MTGTVVQFDPKTDSPPDGAPHGPLRNRFLKLPVAHDSKIWLYRDDLDFVSEGVQFKVNNISCSSSFTAVFDYCVKLKIGSHAACIFLHKQLVEQIMAKMAPEARANFSGAAAALLLELALADVIVQVERLIGRAINFTSVERAPSGPLPRPDAELIAIDATIFINRVATAGRMHLCWSGNKLLAQVLKALPVKRRKIDSLPIAVGFEVGRAVLSLGEFKLLEQGDVIFPEGPEISTNSVLAVVAERLHAKAIAEGNQVRISEPFKRRENMMSDEPLLRGNAQGSPLASLDEIEINLTFEIGRKAMTLSELETLAPGYVFELDRNGSEVIDVVSSGRRIGRADLVEVGDRIGVRLLEIFRHG
jgi:type III secretion protein Q